MRLILATAAALSLLLGVATAPASAAQTLTVTTTADDAGGHCPADAVKQCSLRAAVALNNVDGGGDTVMVPPGRYELDSSLLAFRAISIEGTAAASQTIIDAAGHPGALAVNLKNQADAHATLGHLTVTGSIGRSAILAVEVNPLLIDDVIVRANQNDGSLGGGLDMAFGTTARITNSLFAFNGAGGGGGIAVAPTPLRQSLEIDDSELRGNAAGRFGGGAVLAGFGDVTIDRSRLDDNLGAFGGAITGFTDAGLDPSFLVRNSTLDGNVAGSGDGGAIDLPSDHSGAMQAESDTFVGNSAAGQGADFAGTASAVLLHNSVLGAAQTAACAGAVVSSEGHNLAADASCRLGSSGDRQSIDPRLGPVADNGGRTFTALPAAGSPLIDAADPGGCQRTDQREVARPQGAGCDIGAVERRASEPGGGAGGGSGGPGGGGAGGGGSSGGGGGSGRGGGPGRSAGGLSDSGAIAVAHYGAAEIWLQRIAGRLHLVFRPGARGAHARVVAVEVPAPSSAVAADRREHLALGLDGRGRLTAVMQGARGLVWTSLVGRPSLHTVRGTDGRDTFPSLFDGLVADSRVALGGRSVVLVRSLSGAGLRTVWRGAGLARDTAVGAGRTVAFVVAGARRYTLLLARPRHAARLLLGLRLGRMQRGGVAIDRVAPGGRRLTVIRRLGSRARSIAFALPSGRR